jgi:hypothetical protein
MPIVSAPQLQERRLPTRRTELTEAQCDVIARIG